MIKNLETYFQLYNHNWINPSYYFNNCIYKAKLRAYIFLGTANFSSLWKISLDKFWKIYFPFVRQKKIVFSQHCYNIIPRKLEYNTMPNVKYHSDKADLTPWSSVFVQKDFSWSLSWNYFAAWRVTFYIPWMLVFA